MLLPLLLDASALYKRYVNEPRGCEAMRALVGPKEFRGALFVSEHVEAEIVATLNRRLRRQELSRRDYRDALRLFRQHYPAVFAVVPTSSDLLASSVHVLQQFRTCNIGAPDAQHLAAARLIRRTLDPPALTVVTVDQPMLHVARRMGFRTFDPEIDPVERLRTG